MTATDREYDTADLDATSTHAHDAGDLTDLDTAAGDPPSGSSPGSHLDSADQVWQALTRDPAPLSLDCDALGPGLDLPAGVVSLAVLRTWLLDHPTAYAERDAVWRELARRARLRRQPWTVAAAGMAMPALIRVAARLAAAYPRVDARDIDAEVLLGFLEELTNRADLSGPALYAGFTYAAYRAGRAHCLSQAAHVPVEDIEELAAHSHAPRMPYAHPDLLVHRAADRGLIHPEDVDAYIDVRLGRRAIEPIAMRMGLAVDTLRKRLLRVDDRLVEALADGSLTGAAHPATRTAATAATTRRQAGPARRAHSRRTPTGGAGRAAAA